VSFPIAKERADMSGFSVLITPGDPAGIGPEITLKSFLSSRIAEHRIPAAVVGDLSVLRGVRDRLGIPVELREVSGPDDVEAAELDRGRPVVPVIDTAVISDLAELRVGEVSELAGRAGVEYVRRAVELCSERKKKGAGAGLCTGPLNKESLRAAGSGHIGHTEMISVMSNGRKGITMFLVDRLRIFFHSRHLSLRRAIDAIDKDSVVESLLIAERCLRSVGFPSARIALAALNPHASDGGLFGDEEMLHLSPAAEEAGSRGVSVSGPVPADSVFAQALEGRYDAVLSLYHDQGHVASKTYDFFRTVSVTFGYPFLRTSVDHGTALDIAWRGEADPTSMEEALLAAFTYAPVYTPIYGPEE
jgi:4-hydroxythreonine-4-phosphate dehydrogenase